MLGIPLGLAVANATEWAFHKYVLHGLGKNPKSFWSYHWHEHHKASRAHAHVDEAYRLGVFHWNGQGKEALALTAGAIAIAPLLPVAPLFVGTLWYSTLNYYRVHKRAHLDSTWARDHLPWHYDHHMGPNQHANWCVTKPWWDQLVGTRKPYLGTARERADRAKRAKRSAQRSAISRAA
jgi:sterol desaturase/sphingolipid hydroxylase (fatty acid hydroxylase superfamily)